jgi:hypothetical protein
MKTILWLVNRCKILAIFMNKIELVRQIYYNLYLVYSGSFWFIMVRLYTIQDKLPIGNNEAYGK